MCAHNAIPSRRPRHHCAVVRPPAACDPTPPPIHAPRACHSPHAPRRAGDQANCPRGVRALLALARAPGLAPPAAALPRSAPLTERGGGGEGPPRRLRRARGHRAPACPPRCRPGPAPRTMTRCAVVRGLLVDRALGRTLSVGSSPPPPPTQACAGVDDSAPLAARRQRRSTGVYSRSPQGAGSSARVHGLGECPAARAPRGRVATHARWRQRPPTPALTPPAGGRQDCSLGLLTTKFLQILQNAGEGVVDLNRAAEALQARCPPAPACHLACTHGALRWAKPALGTPPRHSPLPGCRCCRSKSAASTTSPTCSRALGCWRSSPRTTCVSGRARRCRGMRRELGRAAAPALTRQAMQTSARCGASSSC